MRDLERCFTDNLLDRLRSSALERGHFLTILIFILINYRFSFSFLSKIDFLVTNLESEC